MTLKTPQQYVDSIGKLKPRVFIAGKRVENIVEHPNIKPVIDTIAKTYEVALDPQYKDFAATSHLTGEKISRWNHPPRSIEDLWKRRMMNIVMAQKVGGCNYRCAGTEALQILAASTYDMDQKLGTEYHKRFNNFLRYMQDNDLTANMAQTDAKGDRLKRPLEQENPDTYLHVIEKRSDGIVVRGAKLHQVGPMACHEHIIAPPLLSLRQGEEDYALSFAIPNGTEGVTYICQSGPIEAERREAESIHHLGIPEYGSIFTAMMVFDDVFVPWERVFMCGEVEFTGSLLRRLGAMHNLLCRGSCKVGYMDLIIGAARTIAEYNGISGTAHVTAKITDMIRVRETTEACAIAAVHNGKEDPAGSGVYFPDMMFSLVAALNTHYEFPQVALLAADLAGGSVVTMPSERELQNPETSQYVRKYLKGINSVPTENRMRMLKFLQHWTAGPQVAAVQDEGSLEANRFMVYRTSLTSLEEKEKLAKELAGLKE